MQKLKIYAVIVTVLLVGVPIALLIPQEPTQETLILDIENNGETPEASNSTIPEGMDYTSTGALTNVLYDNFYVSTPSEYRLSWQWGSYQRVQGVWEHWFTSSGTVDKNLSTTLVVVVYYTGIEDVKALDGIDALAVFGWNTVSKDYDNTSMSESIVGNCVEFSYSPYPVIVGDPAIIDFFLRIDVGMPEGEYTLMTYLRAL